MKDTLFILAAPFPDGGFEWYCNDCATLEGALLVNPHWVDKIDVRRVAFPRPRKEVIELVGPDWQGLPMLVMDKDRAPGDAIIALFDGEGKKLGANVDELGSPGRIAQWFAAGATYWIAAGGRGSGEYRLSLR